MTGPLQKHLIPFVAFFCFCVQAIAAHQTDETGESNEETGDTDTASPVEVAAGGKLTRERKVRTSHELVNPVHVHLSYESRYVTEGRDNLSGNGLLSASSDIQLGSNVTFVPWLAHSHQSDYTEINLNIVTSFDFGELVELYVIYNHLRIRYGSVEGNDNELEVVLTRSVAPALDVFVDAYYSFDAEHGFIEAGAQNEYDFSPVTSINTSAVLGYNAGYITDGHHGLNHFQVITEVSFFLMEHMELTSYVGYNIAIGSDPVRYTGDVNLRDFLWAGAGFSYYFD